MSAFFETAVECEGCYYTRSNLLTYVASIDCTGAGLAKVGPQCLIILSQNTLKTTHRILCCVGRYIFWL